MRVELAAKQSGRASPRTARTQCGPSTSRLSGREFLAWPFLLLVRRPRTSPVPYSVAENHCEHVLTSTQLGLALGSIPFILREHLSYSELAVFSLSGYPYSLKLFWSPIVDSMFFPSIGRRKSWIIPMQLIIGTTMLLISFRAEQLMNNVRSYTIPVRYPRLPTLALSE